MHFRLVSLVFFLLSTYTWSAPGRSPAVEDFVGIEVEQPPASPGSEHLFNLEQDVKNIQQVRESGSIKAAKLPQPSTPESSPWNLTTVLGALFIMSLPLISWMLVLNHLKNKASEESASNIEVLEKYRQERELARSKGKAEKTDVKKAS
jgi:hypothetical protein